jgi:hypothetical protein
VRVGKPCVLEDAVSGQRESPDRSDWFLLRAFPWRNDADASSGMVTAGLHAESVIECVQRSRQARAGAAPTASESQTRYEYMPGGGRVGAAGRTNTQYVQNTRAYDVRRRTCPYAVRVHRCADGGRESGGIALC